jgi:pyruvate/2-oxoglutarate dehydrogenase complex dihydrolipoamide acyltransferase (E2) component
MVKEICMPKFGQTMEQGTIVKWEKGIGEYIRKGEIFLIIESDKATLDVESEYSGYLIKIVAQVEDEVPCGQVIGYIGDDKNEQV